MPKVEIQGESADRYVEAGSKVVLRCTIRNWLIKPKVSGLKDLQNGLFTLHSLSHQVVFWFRDGQRLTDGQHGVSTKYEELLVPATGLP